MERLALTFAFALVWGVSPHAQNTHRSDPSRQQQSSSPARATFESTCAACHGLDGQGSERGPNIATRPDVVRLSDKDILKILRNGVPSAGMPAFASLGPVELSALLGYLRTLQGKGSTAAIPGTPQKGKRLFFGSARCSECHMVQGNGGFLAEDLSIYATNLSASEIRSAITNPGGDSSQSRSLVTVTLRDGRVIEGIVRNEDNFSLQLQSLDGAFRLVQRPEVAKIDLHAQPLMPAYSPSTLTPAELDDLVGYLMTAARQTKRFSPADSKREDDDD